MYDYIDIEWLDFHLSRDGIKCIRLEFDTLMTRLKRINHKMW